MKYKIVNIEQRGVKVKGLIFWLLKATAKKHSPAVIYQWILMLNRFIKKYQDKNVLQENFI